MARGLIKQSKCTSNCGARRQEGRRNRGDGWCLVLSEWTNWSRTGGGRENMPPGEPQDTSPRLPPQNQHHGSQQHGLILTRSPQLLCGSLFSTVKPSNSASENFYDYLSRSLESSLVLHNPSPPFRQQGLNSMLNFLSRTEKNFESLLAFFEILNTFANKFHSYCENN